MKQTFEEFLDDRFNGNNTSTKDTYEDDIDRWYSNLDVQEIIDYAETWGELAYKEGEIAGIKRAVEIQNEAFRLVSERN